MTNNHGNIIRRRTGRPTEKCPACGEQVEVTRTRGKLIFDKHTYDLKMKDEYLFVCPRSGSLASADE